MSSLPFISIAIAVLIILIGIAAIWAAKINAKERKKFPGKFPEGHFIGKGMAVFLPLGIAIGIPLGNIALGIPIGIAIGLAVGTAWENKAKKEGKIRELTKTEKEVKKKMIGFAFALLALGVIAFLLTLFLF